MRYLIVVLDYQKSFLNIRLEYIVEYEQLVVRGFSRLGYTANWIEDGGYTDVEIRSPEHVVIDVKARSNGRLNSLEVTNAEEHRRERGAAHAIVVSHGLPRKSSKTPRRLT